MFILYTFMKQLDTCIMLALPNFQWYSLLNCSVDKQY